MKANIRESGFADHIPFQCKDHNPPVLAVGMHSVEAHALPAPDTNRPELEQSFVAARTPIEEIVAEIWAEVLKREKVGIHDNFFDLGGHSLLATQVVSRIRERLQAELPLRVLFETPTVAELALQIEQSTSAGDKLDELACKLAEVELLSEEEAEHHLAKKNTREKAKV